MIILAYSTRYFLLPISVLFGVLFLSLKFLELGGCKNINRKALGRLHTNISSELILSYFSEPESYLEDEPDRRERFYKFSFFSDSKNPSYF